MDTHLAASALLPPAGASHAADRFCDEPGVWLADDARRHVDAWQAEVRVGRLRHPVLATVGEPHLVDRSLWRTLRWAPVRHGRDGAPEDDDRLPDFTGRIGLRTRPDGRAEVVVEGRYEPPAGRLGSVLDSLLLHKVAEVTAHQLVGDVADRLTRPDPSLIDVGVGPPR